LSFHFLAFRDFSRKNSLLAAIVFDIAFAKP